MASALPWPGREKEKVIAPLSSRICTWSMWMHRRTSGNEVSGRQLKSSARNTRKMYRHNWYCRLFALPPATTATAYLPVEFVVVAAIGKQCDFIYFENRNKRSEKRGGSCPPKNFHIFCNTPPPTKSCSLTPPRGRVCHSQIMQCWIFF